MSSSIVPSRKPFTVSEAEKTSGNGLIHVQEDVDSEKSGVTRAIFLKSSDSKKGLEKEVVLRKIRQRKRVNKVRAAIGTLFSSPFWAKSDNGSVLEKKWVDDPFTTL